MNGEPTEGVATSTSRKRYTEGRDGDDRYRAKKGRESWDGEVAVGTIRKFSAIISMDSATKRQNVNKKAESRTMPIYPSFHRHRGMATVCKQVEGGLERPGLVPIDGIVRR